MQSREGGWQLYVKWKGKHEIAGWRSCSSKQGSLAWVVKIRKALSCCSVGLVENIGSILQHLGWLVDLPCFKINNKSHYFCSKLPPESNVMHSIQTGVPAAGAAVWRTSLVPGKLVNVLGFHYWLCQTLGSCLVLRVETSCLPYLFFFVLNCFHHPDHTDKMRSKWEGVRKDRTFDSEMPRRKLKWACFDTLISNRSPGVENPCPSNDDLGNHCPSFSGRASSLTQTSGGKA